eukprot:scaffold7637_cov430-Prasinococcus_capsulatus_cf.AAC.4
MRVSPRVWPWARLWASRVGQAVSAAQPARTKPHRYVGYRGTHGEQARKVRYRGYRYPSTCSRGTVHSREVSRDVPLDDCSSASASSFEPGRRRHSPRYSSLVPTRLSCVGP